MMLPLRIELAMTSKAVFLHFWLSARPGHGRPWGRSGGFGLQHTDFARGCQRFAAIPGGMPQAVTALFCWAYRRLRSGNSTALALWSAKSEGIENCPVFVSKTQRQPSIQGNGFLSSCESNERVSTI